MKAKIVILTGLFLAGCSGGAPADLIPPEKMVQVLCAIHLGEQRVSQMGFRAQDSSIVVFQTLEARIYKKYGVDTASYRRSYMYYAARPELFQKLYKTVVDSLQAQRDRAENRPDTLRPRPPHTPVRLLHAK